MRVAFVLPQRSPVPIGGFIVVYEYACRLVARGHMVSVVHPRTIGSPASAVSRAKAALWERRYRRRPELLSPWFAPSPAVQMLAVRDLCGWDPPNVDVMLATTWETVGPVFAARTAERRAMYFVQGYELDGAPEVISTWTLPLGKIVISRWLEGIAAELGEKERTSYVPNGIDPMRWGTDTPLEQRPARVGALLGAGKGSAEIVAAMELAREREPSLLATAFGTGSKPRGLPDWIDYVRLPRVERLRALYNSCGIFVQASRNEGWGLPATEAMACGCALVTCDNGGSREYADDGETALVVEPTPSALGDAVTALVRDPELRMRLARNGQERVAGFRWERSVEMLERALAPRTDAEGTCL